MNYALEGEKLLKKAFFQLKKLFIPDKKNDYQPAFLQSRVLLYVVIALLVVKIISVGLFVPFSKNIFFADITKIDLFNSLNATRQSLGLNTLTENDKLDQAAMLKAQDMVAHEYFAHQSPQGISPWYWFGQAGYKYHYAGENLAIGFFDSSEVFNAWYNSPSHKANLLNPNYKEVGTAIVSGYGNNNTMVVVQLFGSPQTVPAKAPTVPVTPKQPREPKPAQTPPAPQVTVEVNPAPAPEAVPTAPENPVLAQVLGSSTQLQASDKNASATWYYRALNFIVYDYQKLIAYLCLALLTVISIALLINIFVNINVQRGYIIARSLMLIGIIVCSLLVNNNVISHLLPYHIAI